MNQVDLQIPFDETRRLERAIYEHARILDKQLFVEWIDLFTNDGVYCLITFENEKNEGPYIIYDSGTAALKHRAAWLLDIFHVDRAKSLHQISNVEVIEYSDNEAKVHSYFSMYRTVDNGLPRLEATGEYQDNLVRQAGRWKFRERKAVLDNGILPAGFTDLV